MAKSAYTPEFRAMVAQRYIDGEASSRHIGKEYGLAGYTVIRWAEKYKAHGMAAFDRETWNPSYTSQFKTECVECYLRGEMSIEEIVNKYNISSNSVVRKWVERYNANEELKGYEPQRGVYMAEARRKTTLEERKEIVEYCLDHDRNYAGAAAKHGVSYDQVYRWVKKYDSDGERGLEDGRGRRKKDGELDEVERLRRENQRLKEKLEEKEMAVELLKKVKEFERM